MSNKEKKWKEKSLLQDQPRDFSNCEKRRKKERKKYGRKIRQRKRKRSSHRLYAAGFSLQIPNTKETNKTDEGRAERRKKQKKQNIGNKESVWYVSRTELVKLAASNRGARRSDGETSGCGVPVVLWQWAVKPGGLDTTRIKWATLKVFRDLWDIVLEAQRMKGPKKGTEREKMKIWRYERSEIVVRGAGTTA